MSASLDTLIPHRAPMQWIDALIDCTDTTARATVCFTAGHFAVTGGAVAETALIECMAQTVAAALGQRSLNGGSASRADNGMLGAVSNFRMHGPILMDRRLLIEVREVKRFGPMLLVAGVVSCEGQIVAEGQLSLYA